MCCIICGKPIIEDSRYKAIETDLRRQQSLLGWHGLAPVEQDFLFGFVCAYCIFSDEENE